MNRNSLIQSLMITFMLIPFLLLFPEGSQAITGEDGSLWVQINPPGFGNQDNLSIVALSRSVIATPGPAAMQT